MKRILLPLFFIFLSVGINAQTATNFNANDCNSVNHDLFTELDAGKVIVICWVMPCVSCINSASTNATTVQSFAASYPGRVKYYLLDDVGDTPCGTLTTWANTNGITTDANFSNNVINMNDYGAAAMPKTVVLGGTSHTVFYNADGAVLALAETIAIQNALAATGISENTNSISAVNLFPNPAQTNSTVVSYHLTQPAAVSVNLYSAYGELVNTVEIENASAGEHETTLDLSSMSNGVYFIRLGAGESSTTTRLVIAE